MPHYLTVGMTGSGKSVLGKALAAAYRRCRRPVAVLDPMYDEHWPADFKTPEVEAFFRFAWSRKGWMLFIDEAGDIGKYDKAIQKLMTQGRHLGHSIHIITQFPQQLSPLVRGQCCKAYVFNVGEDEIEVVAKSFNKKELLALPPPLIRPHKNADFYIVDRFAGIGRYLLDFRTGQVYTSPETLPSSTET